MSINEPSKYIRKVKIKPEYIWSTTHPKEWKCYCDRTGKLFFVSHVFSDSMYYHMILANGTLWERQSIQFRDTSYRSPSKWRVHWGEYKQCYICKKKISYCIRIEQQQDTLQQIYENFKVLSPN